VNDASEPGGGNGPEDRQEPFLFRLVRTAIAPPVLKDGGHDAPMSRRGRLIFWSIVIVLVIGIAILLVASLHR
jgi:hypothetical protein